MYRALLFDVMGTLVEEPFHQVVPRALGMTVEDLLAAKDPTAWVEFERGAIDEAELRRRFFADGRDFDFDGLKRAMIDAYAWIDGVEPLLAELRAAGHELHLFSNYPVWYREIERKLGLSRYAAWTFVSCHTGLRKPEPEAYRLAVAHFAGGRLLFVDDRGKNCAAAAREGLDAVKFESSERLRAALRERGLLESCPGGGHRAHDDVC